LVAAAAFRSLSADIAVQPQWIASFWSYSPKPNIASFAQTVRDALTNAQYQIADLLCLIPGIDMWRGQY
jgi:hypothetical protein